MVTAEKPEALIEKGSLGPELLAHVAVSKYGDHLPLNRQEEIFHRQGIELSRQTMCDWMRACAELASLLYGLMKEGVLASKAVQMDDTPVPVLDPELPRTHTGRIWTYVGDDQHPYTVYDYTPTRSRDGPDAFLQKFRLEREARDQNLQGEARRELRQAKSKPILDDLHAYLQREQPEVLSKSPEGQAIAYTLPNWKALIRYCEDGDLEIDNNGAERSLRGVAVGRKSWMFYGSDQGGRTAAVLTSLIATCKRIGVDPFAYLRDVFEHISSYPQNRLAELLPDQWQAAPPPAATF